MRSSFSGSQTLASFTPSPILRQIDNIDSARHPGRRREESIRAAFKNCATKTLRQAFAALRLHLAPVFPAEVVHNQAKQSKRSGLRQIDHLLQIQLQRDEQARRPKRKWHAGVFCICAGFGHRHHISGAAVDGAEGTCGIPAPAIQKAALPEKNALRAGIIQSRHAVNRALPRSHQLCVLRDPAAKTSECAISPDLHLNREPSSERRGRESNPRIDSPSGLYPLSLSN